VAVEFAVGLTELAAVGHGQLAALLGVLAHHDAELARRGVDDRDGVAFREHEPVAGGIGRIVRAPAHRVKHEDGDDVAEAESGRRVARTGGGGHLNGDLVQLDGLGVDGGFE
jgi:hypothetical protein